LKALEDLGIAYKIAFANHRGS